MSRFAWMSRSIFKSRSIRTLLLACFMLAVARPLFSAVVISVGFGPPALPVYEQPLCPGDGYIWTPGYWAWDPSYGYYWIPGTWVLAPQVGYLWTPPWWGWNGGAYIFHGGYWGPTIGFYGGINYGFGYFGTGFDGGRWQGNRFFYNTAVVHVDNVHIHNVYNTVIVNRGGDSRVSFNGGHGGLTARPTAAEEAAGRERHLAPIASQQQHFQAARNNPQMRASANQGRPPIAATARPGAFTGHNAVAATQAGAAYHAPHANELPEHQVTQRPSTGNAATDQRNQQQEQQMVQRQNQEHQQLQQQQEREDRQAQQNNASQQQRQAMEQRHTQQTVQMEQRHTTETQNFARQVSHGGGGGGGRPPHR